MIVVLGSLALREGPTATPSGRAAEIAMAAAARGARAEVVGRVGDDRAGDALVIALAGAGVGHAAVLRDPVHATPVVTPPPADEDPDPFADESPVRSSTGGGPRLEPADATLGLSYLTSFAVLVVADDVPANVLPACVEGAQFAGAHLMILLAPGRRPPASLPVDATVLVAPDVQDDGAFAALVGAYAAAIDAGEEPASAFRTATGAVGWEAAPADA